MKKNISETAQASLGDKKEYPTKALPAHSAQIRIPSQRPIPQLNHHVKRETEQVSKEWSEEVSHTDQVSFHLPPTSAPAADLAPKRIQRFHQKKTLAVLKKMAELHEAASLQVDHKVMVAHESNGEQKQQQAQEELWRDMIKPHVERKFQIDRFS